MTVGLKVTVQSNMRTTRARMERAVFNGLTNAEKTLLGQAKDLLVSKMAATFKHETPFYRTKVRIIGNRVDDSNVIYGPWLEGTGSRNHTTRFKGYAIFRKVKTIIAGRKNYVTNNAIKAAIKRAGL